MTHVDARLPAIGDELAGRWRIVAVDARHGRLRWTLQRGDDAVVIGLAVAEEGEGGAWARPGVRAWYERNSVEAVHFDAAANHLLESLGNDGVLQLQGWIDARQAAPPRQAPETHVSRTVPGDFAQPDTPLAGGWRVAATAIRGQSIHVDVTSEDGSTTTLRFACSDGPAGPFGRHGISVTHSSRAGNTSGWAERLHAAANAWLDRLDETPAGVHAAIRAATRSPTATGLASAHRRVVVRESDADRAASRAGRLLDAMSAGVNDATTLVTDLEPSDGRIQTLVDKARDRGIKLVVDRRQVGQQRAIRTGERPNIPSELELVVESPTSPSSSSEATGDWQQRVRDELIGHPDRSLVLAEILSADEVPMWPCALPWVRFEVSPNGWFGPCCRDYQALHTRLPRTALPDVAWNGPAMQAFRRAMTTAGHPSTCQASCPFLHAGNQKPADVRVPGGPAAAVENAIVAIEDMISGAEVMRADPMQLCLAATTFCNYDCLMCDYGETGTLDDELPSAFWESLRGLLGSVFFLEVNGGEPLASPVFRDFLGTLDARELPQLRILLITNGSYLTPKQLRRYANVPFENITLSLNAASEDCYALVNRGLPWSRIRQHLDAIAATRRAGTLHGRVQYSMVVLKQNRHEIEAFADLARADGAAVRYQLPLKDRNDSSIMTDETAMLDAMARLERVGKSLLDAGRVREARGAIGSAQVLFERIAAGITRPL